MKRPMAEILVRILAWLLPAVVAAGCASTDDPVIKIEHFGQRMTFKFTISADGAPSQTRAAGVWEESPADVAERILDPDDLRIMIFDQSGVLLTTVRPSLLDFQGDETSNDGYYTLSVNFTHEYFDKFDDTATVTFQVMILANLEAIGGSYADYRPGITRAGDITDHFAMAPDYYPTPERGIPMYGLKGFSIPKEDMMRGIDAPIAGDIDLLRSLCKIEIADRIANATEYPDGGRYPRVTGVEMISWRDHGYIATPINDYFLGLRSPNIYSSTPTSTETVTARETGGCYRLYCPESEVGEMRFRVSAQLRPGEEVKQYEIGLEPFTGKIGGELIRNHIYRFDVHALNTLADLRVEVSDWTTVTDEFDLDNIVGIEPDGFLSWSGSETDFAVSTETYNGQREQQLSILNGTNGYATGTFHITSPRGATWKAYFIPGENGVDAFEFVDIDTEGSVISGSESVIAQGNVGERATIHIRGKGNADSYRHWVELVVEVKTADGNIVYAPLTPALSPRFIIYRENRL